MLHFIKVALKYPVPMPSTFTKLLPVACGLQLERKFTLQVQSCRHKKIQKVLNFGARMVRSPNFYGAMQNSLVEPKRSSHFIIKTIKKG
jgi:predicted nucleic acid binding AN1-type Zn finger protein